MAKVWLVSQGVYSDMKIVGVYSSLELADAAAAVGDDCDVYDRDGCEIDANEALIRSGASLWRVRFNSDGNVTTAVIAGLPSGQTADATGMQDGGVVVYCDGQSKAHAIKIAADARAQHLAFDA